MTTDRGRVFYVYEHWRPDTDSCFYVGKGMGRRAYNMSWRNPHHKAIQTKLSRLGMCAEVRLVADCLTEAEALEFEIKRIAYWREKGNNLVNRTDGGEGVSGLAAHNRLSVTCLNDGKIFVSATAAADHYGLHGVTVSNVCTEVYRSANDLHFVYGEAPKTQVDRDALILERELMFAKKRKRVEGEIVQRHTSIENGKDALGRRASGPLKNAKAVICLDDGKEFYAISEAARFYNLCSGQICATLKGANGRKTVGGRRFAYKDNG